MEISELKDKLSEDFNRIGSYDRYPVRFFSMSFDENTSNSIIDINKYVKKASYSKDCEIIDFKDWLRHDDAWITKEMALYRLNRLEKSKNYIVVGLSEYARFLSNAEFITVIEALLEIENDSFNQKRRIYFPCLALYSQVIKTVNTIYRRKDIFNPFLNKTLVEDLPRIYFVQEDLISSKFLNIISNSKEWFGLWRDSNIDIKKPIICLSKTLLHFYGKACPDNVYNIKAITNYPELLKSIYSIDMVMPHETKPEEFYAKFVKLIHDNQGKSLNELILKELNTLEITEKTVSFLWKASNEFHRWLLKNYIFLYYNKESYLYHVMIEISDMKEAEFYGISYCYIFKEQKKNYYQERNTILKAIYDLNKTIDFGEHLKSYYSEVLYNIIPDKCCEDIKTFDFSNDLKCKETVIMNTGVQSEIEKHVLSYITQYSEYERRLILWLYRNNLASDENIKKIYPEFSLYLFSGETINMNKKMAKLSGYFDIYRKCRVSTLKPEEYHEELMQWNSSENNFYEWYLDVDLLYPENVLKKNSIEDNVIVLDGVGGEYLDYIKGFLKEKGYIIDLCIYTKSHLPSITSQAKKYFSDKFEWNREYDSKVVHGEIYYHVSNLEKSLTVIKRMIEEILNTYEGKKIAIIADHGATINHKLIKKSKLYDFESSDHGGRCYKNDSNKNISETNDYMNYQDESGMNWVIALNEQSLHNSSTYAVHGGATIEEVIVPLIITHPSEDNTKSYRVIEKELNVSGINKTIRIKIQPKPENVILTASDGTNVHMQYEPDTNTWQGALKRGIEQPIDICINNNQTFSYRTIPTTKMKGNDGFDD